MSSNELIIIRGEEVRFKNLSDFLKRSGLSKDDLKLMITGRYIIVGNKFYWLSRSNLTYKDIGKILGLSREMVRLNHIRTLNKIKSRLKKEGYNKNDVS